ncbi:hypothetical protein Tco_0007152 [Tanacetum coccineum]
MSHRSRCLVVDYDHLQLVELCTDSRTRPAWKEDLRIGEEVGGGGGGGVVGGVGVVCGDGVDRGVRSVDCGVVCGFVCGVICGGVC